MEFRRARVVSKGGAIEYAHWATPAVRLLTGRARGPAFVADRRGPAFDWRACAFDWRACAFDWRACASDRCGPASGRRARASGRRAPALGGVCPITGRGRLSYPRAEELFKTASAELVPHRQRWPLHQPRQSALQHLAQAGRAAPELQAKSRHQHLAGLGRCGRLGEETSARSPADADPIQRRRPRRPRTAPWRPTAHQAGHIRGACSSRDPSSAHQDPGNPHVAGIFVLPPVFRDEPARQRANAFAQSGPRDALAASPACDVPA
ncbi:hypothetical protein ACIBP6_38220 [Nonomuraea terrae]|uniref:hypothetical protein n=1 Tax=Nonomuraea terrae TaxID=2530383 RepID=UPI0037A92001